MHITEALTCSMRDMLMTVAERSADAEVKARMGISSMSLGGELDLLRRRCSDCRGRRVVAVKELIKHEVRSN